MNSDLEQFDKEDDGGLDALPHVPTIVFVGELDEKIQLRNVKIVEEDRAEITQANGT